MKVTKKLLLIILSAILITALISFRSNAEENQPILIKARATAYCLQGTMANGEEVRSGTCAMSDRKMIGKTLIMYQRLPDGSVGEMIGIYDICDTGCKKNVIDVWCPNLEECQLFMNRVYEDGCKGKVYIQILDEVNG